MKNFKNKKTLQIVLLVAIAVLTLGIGYASITAINLLINGNATASVNQENFKVYFTQAQSITGSTGVSGTSSIDDNDATIAYFDVSGLTKVGDYGVATYTISNNSNGIGADISLQLTNSNNEYFKITETVADSQLQAGDTTTATIRVEMIKTPIQADVTTSVTGTLTATPIENENATGSSPKSKIAGEPESFATDSWATIKKAVQDNNTSAYNIGDTKEVTINNVDYTVRLANKSTGDHCGDNDTEYSQTACGFVVEFQDIITEMQMKDANSNVGGYPATLVYDYLKNTLYGQLPSDLQAAIKPTRVISGHGPDDSTNFTTTDNLYLLSGVEVFGSDDYDTAAGTTHQLEFYQGMEADATTSWGAQAYSRTYKGYNGSDGSTEYWWLRPAASTNSNNFRTVYCGYLSHFNAGNTDSGLAPAFRIG